MPRRDPALIQADFPLLIADLIDQLQLTGTVGVLDFRPEIQPVFIVGSRGLTILTEDPVFATASVVFDENSNPIINKVLLSTAALPAGDYDVQAFMSVQATTGGTIQALQLRNAGDTATLAQWNMISDAPSNISQDFKFAIAVPDLAFFRIINLVAITSGRNAGTVMTRIRTTP